MKKTVLNSLKIYDNLVKFDKIDFGCDYLTLSYTNSVGKFNELLYGIDNDNSNFGVTEICGKDFTYNRIVTSNGLGLTFSIDYNGISTPLFQYLKFNKESRIILGKSAKICVYGSYFRLWSIGEFDFCNLLSFLETISEEDPVITRYDYRIDYFSINSEINVPTIPDILGYIHSQSSQIVWKSGGKINDWRVGNPDTGKYAIRYYDKKLDTNKKDKWFLYADFLDYKTVHRLEIQFGRAFCREFTLSQFYDLECKILEVLGIDGKIYDRSVFYQYNSSSEITVENANKFIQRFNKLSDKLFKAGYSPFTILESYFGSKYGKDVVKGMLEDFINKSIVYGLNDKYGH